MRTSISQMTGDPKMTGNHAVKVVVVEDHHVVRAGLIAVLGTEPGIQVVGEAANGAEGVEVVKRVCPDVVLMDLQMPVMDGVEATARIVKEMPNTSVIILTTFGTDGRVAEALKAGARQMLVKDVSVEGLVKTVREASLSEPL